MATVTPTKRNSAGKGKGTPVSVINLNDLPNIHSGLPLDKSTWPKSIGYDNRAPGAEGIASTYLAYDDAEVKSLQKAEIESIVPKYRNLSDGVMGHLLSLGIDGRLLGRWWGANFSKEGLIRAERKSWGSPYTARSGQVFVVVDYPLCGSHEPVSYIEKNGFLFLENSSNAQRSGDAERRNRFLLEVSLCSVQNTCTERMSSTVAEPALFRQWRHLGAIRIRPPQARCLPASVQTRPDKPENCRRS